MVQSSASTPAGEAHPPFSPNVHTVQLEGKTLYLIGTAHVSRKSVEEVEQVVAQVKPDSVAVELCQARHHALAKPDSWMEMDLFKVVRQGRATMLLAHLILSAFQRRMGDKLHIRPGQEMVAAMEAAEKHGAQLVLADRDVQTTLRRTWSALGWWDKFKLTFHMSFSLFGGEELTEEEIEQMKGQDVLTEIMESFAKAFPKAKTALIDERDYHLAHRIRQAPGQTVVGVVGAGHVEGILALLKGHTDEETLAPLLAVPRAGWLSRAIQWGIPLLVLGMIGYGFFTAQGGVSWEMIKIWVLTTGLLAAAGAVLSLAHPLTIVASFVAAPFTTLHPLLAAGWVAGLVEAVLHKPRVADLERLSGDITSFKGFWGNRVTRILLVVALVNLGASIGTFAAIPMMSALIP